jgi:site-specific recombinase XerD
LNNSIAYLDVSASSWDRTLYAFLAEKQRRSGSDRTVQSYSRMLNDFFGRSGKTPDQVTSQDAFAWAYGVGLSGKTPSSITIGARLACLSSFYRFLIRMKVVAAKH